MEEVDKKKQLVLMSSVYFSVTHLEDDTHVEEGCFPHKQTKTMSET